MSTCHAHPATIFGNLWRVMYLIVIPVLRGFFLALQDNLEAWIRGAWADVLIFLIMLGVAALRWRALGLQWDDKMLRFRRGLFFSGEAWVPWRKIVTICVTGPFYLRIFGAVRLRADVLGHSGKKAVITVLLRPDAADEILRRYSGQPQGEEEEICYSPRSGSVIALSLLNSNSLAGVVFIAAFISQSGKLLGNKFSARIVDAFEEASRSVAVFIPPAAAAIALLLLAGWAISFFLSFLRHKNTRISQRDATLNITGGILNKQRYAVRRASVSFVDIRQSLTTKILGLRSLYIPSPEGGGRGEDMICVIPAEKRERFEKIRSFLFGGFSPSRLLVRPRADAAARFLAMPLSLAVLVAAAMFAAVRLLESWRGFILFAGLMGLAPVFLFLTVRIFDYRTGGLSRSGDVYTLRYSKWLYLHTVVVRADKIVQIQLTQSAMQRRGGSCDAVFHIRAGKLSRHVCRGIELEKTKSLTGGTAEKNQTERCLKL